MLERHPFGLNRSGISGSRIEGFKLPAGRRPVGMPKPLSLDLRPRVLAAISGSLSCRKAAVRFGVSAFERDPLAGSGAQTRRREAALPSTS
jgi:hypothetical protein